MTRDLADPGLLNLLFPFHFILDERLGFLQSGTSLRKMLPELSSFEQDFKLVRPGLGIEYTFDSIVGYSDQVFILKPAKEHSNIMLKGQFVHLEKDRQLLFVGSPWITSEQDFQQTGLKLRDFSLHDSVVDLLQHVKVQQMAVEDVNEMNRVLTRKNEELIALNQSIQEARIDQEVKNAELRKINAELDRFVYSISHDLRSPLLSIKGVLQLIPVKEKINEGTLKYLQLAEKSVNRLDQTIQEILDYSRNARLDVKLSEFSLIQMVEGIFTDLRFASEEHVEFLLEVQGPVQIKSDRYRLETLLKNTIGNAVKYRNRGIAMPWVQVKISTTSDQHTIRISDNGIGISEKSLPRIFDMFYRGSSAVSGTGLGLYICKEMIARMGGTLHVESELGKGSTFTINIPSN